MGMLVVQDTLRVRSALGSWLGVDWADIGWEFRTVGFFSASDGTRIFYQDWGSGDPVVFTHSWLLDSNAWEYQFHALVEAGLRCIGLDRRGHGRSDVPGTGYD